MGREVKGGALWRLDWRYVLVVRVVGYRVIRMGWWLMRGRSGLLEAFPWGEVKDGSGRRIEQSLRTAFDVDWWEGRVVVGLGVADECLGRGRGGRMGRSSRTEKGRGRVGFGRRRGAGWGRGWRERSWQVERRGEGKIRCTDVAVRTRGWSELGVPLSSTRLSASLGNKLLRGPAVFFEVWRVWIEGWRREGAAEGRESAGLSVGLGSDEAVWLMLDDSDHGGGLVLLFFWGRDEGRWRGRRGRGFAHFDVDELLPRRLLLRLLPAFTLPFRIPTDLVWWGADEGWSRVIARRSHVIERVWSLDRRRWTKALATRGFWRRSWGSEGWRGGCGEERSGFGGGGGGRRVGDKGVIGRGKGGCAGSEAGGGELGFLWWGISRTEPINQ
jgi:hypothetical protein